MKYNEAERTILKYNETNGDLLDDIVEKSANLIHLSETYPINNKENELEKTYVKSTMATPINRRQSTKSLTPNLLDDIEDRSAHLFQIETCTTLNNNEMNNDDSATPSTQRQVLKNLDQDINLTPNLIGSNNSTPTLVKSIMSTPNLFGGTWDQRSAYQTSRVLSNFLFPTPAPATPFGMTLFGSLKRNNLRANFTLSDRKLDFEESIEENKENFNMSSLSSERTYSKVQNISSAAQLIDRDFFDKICERKKKSYKLIHDGLLELKKVARMEQDLDNYLKHSFQSIGKL